MIFKGKGKVQWAEQEGSSKNRRTVTYRDEEEFYSSSHRVWGSGEDMREVGSSLETVSDLTAR